MVAIEVAAVKATVEPREGTARRKDRVAASQTVRMGERNRLSTLWKKEGRAPSLLKANIMRELEVMEKRPQCQTQVMTRVMRTMAPFSPKMSMKIWRTGWEYVLLTVVSKFWMEKRSETMRKNPKTKETLILIMTPMGALQAAFLVSSERWAEASKPVMVYWLMRMPQQATYAVLARTLHPGPSTPVPS